MENDFIMTMDEAKDRIAHYKEIFSEVRLLESVALKDESGLSLGCCGAEGAYEAGTQKTKLKICDSKIYLVIEKYLEINGKSYILELSQIQDDSWTMDSDAYEHMQSAGETYNEKLYLDALTGIYNRRYYEDKLRTRTMVAGIAWIDVDDFKVYNDTYGHHIGDIILKSIADAIRACIRKNDVLVRMGGDEFVLILNDVKPEFFPSKLEQIKETVHKIVIAGHRRIRLSVSIGGVIAQNEPLESAMHKADKLMYVAKSDRNAVMTELKASEEALEKSRHAADIKKDRPKILIVDDSEMNREILKVILEEDYEISEAASGEECLKKLHDENRSFALILLDIMMSGMDGFEVLSIMNKEHWIEDIPVIMISSEDTASSVRYAFELGISDYIGRPFDASIVYQRVRNMIKLYAKQRRLKTLITDQIYEREKNNRMMISILSQIVEFRNGENGAHITHINHIVELLLDRLVQKTDKYQLTWSDQRLIIVASSLHDIGKIGIDENIVRKKTPLTRTERETMKMHTMIGASMISNLEMYKDEPLIKIAYQICRWHHERYDGSGYPDKLKGDDIPIVAQVVSLADTYDRLTGHYLDKTAYSHEEAVQKILNGESGAFNPLLLECMDEVKDLIKKGV